MNEDRLRPFVGSHRCRCRDAHCRFINCAKPRLLESWSAGRQIIKSQIVNHVTLQLAAIICVYYVAVAECRIGWNYWNSDDG